jgi:hypothetical protein
MRMSRAGARATSRRSAAEFRLYRTSETFGDPSTPFSLNTAPATPAVRT